MLTLFLHSKLAYHYPRKPNCFMHTVNTLPGDDIMFQLLLSFYFLSIDNMYLSVYYNTSEQVTVSFCTKKFTVHLHSMSQNTTKERGLRFKISFVQRQL